MHVALPRAFKSACSCCDLTFCTERHATPGLQNFDFTIRSADTISDSDDRLEYNTDYAFPRTVSPPSQELTFQPRATSDFRKAGFNTLTWPAECVPRPVTI